MKKIMTIVLFLSHRVIAMEQNQENNPIKPESIKINKKLEKAVRKKDEACYVAQQTLESCQDFANGLDQNGRWLMYNLYRAKCLKYTRRVDLLKNADQTKYFKE